MAALANERTVPATKHLSPDGVINKLKMAASITIYKGALVCYDLTTGYVTPATTDAANRAFAGIALESKTNGTTAGATEIDVVYPEYFIHAVTSATLADFCKGVVPTDDQTIAIGAAGGAGSGVGTNFIIGWIAYLYTGTTCLIKTIPMGSGLLS